LDRKSDDSLHLQDIKCKKYLTWEKWSGEAKTRWFFCTKTRQRQLCRLVSTV